MDVVGTIIIEEFGKLHPDSMDQLASWLAEAQAAKWKSPMQMKKMFPSASLLGKGRTIFNIKGNRYLLDTQINYEFQAIRIVRIGTHAEYDKWTY